MKKFKQFIKEPEKKEEPKGIPFVGFIKKIFPKKKPVEKVEEGIVDFVKNKVLKMDHHDFDKHDDISWNHNLPQYKRSKKLRDQIQSHANTLNRVSQHPLQRVIKDYTTTDGARNVNNHLIREAGFHPSKDDNEYERGGISATHTPERIKHIDHFLSGIIKAHKTTKPMVVHSGVAFHPHKMADKDGVVHLPAYTSTSLSERVARGFARDPEGGSDSSIHKIKIHIPVGSHALYAEPHTYHRDEHEVVLHKGAKIKIHPKPTIKKGAYTVHTWHAKLIHDGVKDV